MAPNATLRRIPIPPAQDPFVNTPLLSLGPGDDGQERFWISSWNSVSGTLGVLVTESGQERIYRFEPPHFGFYSAVQEDSDTLWLCGDLSRVVRLSLGSGKVEVFDTGAPAALMFQGMILDPIEGKLFAVAFPPPTPTGFVFDYRNRVPLQVYPGLCDEHYQCNGFTNGDGTYTAVVYNPDVAFLRWDPRDDSVTKTLLSSLVEDLPRPFPKKAGIARMITDDEGAVYLPYFGWYQPATQTMAPGGPRPEREMTWFARRDGRAWGVSAENGGATVAVWNLDTGEVTDLCSVPDGLPDSVVLTESGALVAVSMFGEFRRFDGDTGALQMARKLPTNSVGHIDCLCRIDDTRLLGTTFITQRFWEVDLNTGEGYDCGRAAPGGGEVLLTWNLNGTVYMAAYTGGELTEYRPDIHPHFPENPRVVATPLAGMRPIAGADDGRRIFYSCSHYYGHLGCVLTRYDTVTGEAVYADDPLPLLAIRSMSSVDNVLLVGTMVDADCQSTPALADRASLALIDPDTMEVVQRCDGPVGTTAIHVVGSLSPGTHLCVAEKSGLQRWFSTPIYHLSIPEFDDMSPLPADAPALIPTGKPGLVILATDGRTELWDMRTVTRIKVVSTDASVYKVHVQDDTVYLTTPREILVLDACLAG